MGNPVAVHRQDGKYWRQSYFIYIWQELSPLALPPKVVCPLLPASVCLEDRGTSVAVFFVVVVGFFGMTGGRDKLWD